MAREQVTAQEPISYEIALKLRDLEESHRLTKERVLLIGQNLIDMQEKNSLEITKLKTDIYELKTDMNRIKEIISSLTEEIEKSARKEEIAILSRQFKMFEPLRFVRIEDVEKIIDEKMHKSSHQDNNQKEIKSNQHAFWSGKI
jgi:hypothetical protein